MKKFTHYTNQPSESVQTIETTAQDTVTLLSGTRLDFFYKLKKDNIFIF